MKQFRLILVACALLLVGAPSAFALLLNISATWSSSFVQPTGHLQVGSIIQVVAYNSQDGHYPGSSTLPGENFLPYGATDPQGTSIEDGNTGVYQPDTTLPATGNEIVYTGQLQSDGNGGLTFHTYLHLDNAYDNVYIRVFSSTEFEQGVVADSWWGISTNRTLDVGPGTIGIVWWDDEVAATNHNYFEVIPEPGALGLLWSGACGLLGAGVWRRRRRDGKARNGETGDGEP